MPVRARITPALVGAAAVAAFLFLVCGDDPPPHPQMGVADSPRAEPSPRATPSEGEGMGGGGRERLSSRKPAQTVPVLRVVDGDTFHVLRSGRDETIRLIGIDTPEVGWYGSPAECFGGRAGRFANRLLEGRRVHLEFDQERLDPYDRTLAYAYLDARMVNLILVRRGMAEVTIYPPNDRYAPRLHGAERDARRRGIGLWSACR